jgi:hypothetical protein
VDIAELAKRMYGHPPCCREQCKEHCRAKRRREEEEIRQVQNMKQKYRAVAREQEAESEASVSERMHNYARLREMKRLELASKHQLVER